MLARSSSIEYGHIHFIQRRFQLQIVIVPELWRMRQRITAEKHGQKKEAARLQKKGGLLRKKMEGSYLRDE